MRFSDRTSRVFGYALATVIYFAVGMAIIAGGLVLGSWSESLRAPLSPPRFAASDSPLLNWLTQWDGQWYLRISEVGYEYQVDSMSSVAFFPLYPLLACIVQFIGGVSEYVALVIVSHGCIAGSLWVWGMYLRTTGPQRLRISVESKDADRRTRRATAMAMAALVLYPPGFFLWMAYSESLFLLLCLVVMLEIQLGWRPVWIALVIGAATATRLVGVALLLPLALYVWWRIGGTSDDASQISAWRRYVRASVTLLALTPLACWGLLAYMGYQWFEFGTPFAFAQTQQHWSMRPPLSLPTKALILASAEPIWSAYLPGSAGHWARLEDGLHPLLCLRFFDPLFFIGAVMLIYVGALKRWLNPYEILMAWGMLLLAYAGKGYEMAMASQARYTTVVFPIYIVIGQIMARLPWWVSGGYFALSATYLGIYSAMWAAGHIVI